jgi:hypothetical protein
VTDPWSDFARAAEDREVAGYFERTSRGPGQPGRALSFLTAAEVRTVTPNTSPKEEAAHIARFLGTGGGRATLGFLGFDAVGLFEPRLRTCPAGGLFPLGAFALVDHPTRTLVAPRPAQRSPGAIENPGSPISDTLSRRPFERSVRRLVEEIRNGEAYQVVLGHRRTWKRPADLLARAGRLRSSERFAFFYYLRFGDLEVVGATPESVVEVTGDRAYLNPIAGTIPRGPG